MNRNEKFLSSFLTRIFTCYKLVTMNHNDQEEMKNVDKAVLKMRCIKNSLYLSYFTLLSSFLFLYIWNFLKSSSIKNWGLFVTQQQMWQCSSRPWIIHQHLLLIRHTFFIDAWRKLFISFNLLYALANLIFICIQRKCYNIILVEKCTRTSGDWNLN